MKRFLILFTMIWASMAAALPALAEKTLDIKFNHTPVEQAIAELRKQSGYEFVYQKNIFVPGTEISGNYSHHTLEQILSRAFQEDLNIAFEIVDKTVILSKAEKELPYFKRQVTGMVVDENQEPLIGASVLLEGTNIGTATDVDGMFSLMVEGKKPMIRVSYVGMKSKQIALKKNERNLTVVLEEDPQLMSEVIVTGYSNFKRESATGSYQTITAEDLAQRHMGTITDNLEGKVPGMVTYDNGNGKQMKIRGTGSFEATTNPLVVVDGLPIEGSIETVNPYDIANITVLKDAAAAAIYGARASNGVIVITTKRAQGNKTQVDFNADVTTYEKRDYSYLKFASAAEVVELEGYNFNAVANSDNPASYNSLLSYYRNGRTNALSPATLLYLRNHLGEINDSELQTQLDRLRSNNYIRDWQRNFETPKVNQQYNLAVRHNSESLASSLNLNYERDNNSTPGDYISNLMFGYNGMWKVFSRLDVNFGINLLSERTKNHIMGSNSPVAYLPYYSMYESDGSLYDIGATMLPDRNNLGDPKYGFKSMFYNPVSDFGSAMSRERRTNIRSYVNAIVTILPGWTASGQFQYEDIYYKGDSYYSGDSYEMRSMYNLYTGYDRLTGTVNHYIPEEGMLKTTTSEGAYYTFRAQTNYENNFGGKHDINAVAGFEFRQQNTKTYGNVLLGYDDATQTNANSMVNWGQLKEIAGSASAMASDMYMYGAPEDDSFTTGDILHRFYSIYFTGNYVYDTRYTLTGSFRIDKADLFGADPKFRGTPLWSVGLGWNLHNEAFLRDTDWLDALKLRASYGITGNIANDVSSYLTGTIGINDIYGNKFATIDTPPNDQLRWEKTKTWNVGVDFSFWNSRLTGAIDFYSKNGSDLLTNTDLDPTTGWNVLKINNGKVRNTGIELQLNGDILRAASRKDVALSADLSLAWNHNKVVKVAHEPVTGLEALSPYTIHKGYPVNALFSYDFAGMKTEDGLQYFTWRDANGGIHTTDISSEEFTVNDIVYSGSLDPKVVASFTPTGRWEGFSLSAMLCYYGGHVMRADVQDWVSDGSQYGYGGLSMLSAVPSSFLNFWKEGGDKYPGNGVYGFTNVVGNPSYANHTVVPADFLKVRNLVLGYSFNDAVCKALRMQNLRLRFQVNNLCYWARNNKGIDPEANDPMSGQRQLRTPRSYTFSINFSF